MGWDLSGVSYVMREGPRGGAPQYDDEDRFTLDVMPLLPCQSDTDSPSCQDNEDGPYFAQIENYARIRYDRANDQWILWAPSGVRSTYKAVHTIEKDSTEFTWKYALTETEDTLGNQVSYRWRDDLFDCCGAYLEGIDYGQGRYAVHFFWEIRTDLVQRANVVTELIGEKGGPLTLQYAGLDEFNGRVAQFQKRIYAPYVQCR